MDGPKKTPNNPQKPAFSDHPLVELHGPTRRASADVREESPDLYAHLSGDDLQWPASTHSLHPGTHLSRNSPTAAATVGRAWAELDTDESASIRKSANTQVG